MLTSLTTLLADEAGATMVEYSLIVALIAIVCVGAITALGGKVNTNFTTASNAL